MSEQLDLFGDPQLPLPNVYKQTTIGEAQDRIRELAEDGVTCPCCGQYAKVYRRPLNVTMARGLIWLVCTSGGSPNERIDTRRCGPKWLVAAGGEFAKLAHWTLIRQRVNEDTGKRTSGVWAPTKRGVEFAYGRIAIASHVHLYNNSPVGFSGRTNIHGALGTKFDYEELMNG